MQHRLKTYLLLLLLAGTTSCGGSFSNLWQTPDQQGIHLVRAGKNAEAADQFVDPLWKGTALFRDGQFEAAAAAFARLDTALSAFNRGNALVLLGKYDEAMLSYDRALQLRPDWKEAKDNREIARLREARKAPPDSDAGGTGGKLAADEIVFDDRAKNSSQQQVVEVGAGEPLSDEALRALWLRSVQTKPRDFLRAKFAYQQARAQKKGESK